ncbi:MULTISPECIES: septum formation initiator family protein [Roseivirga]|jgi:cell division protein FtsB|uniref:FtsB family cell division protein n=1 Tax=Roseivirga TaxID=290180 RepID=UPI00257F8135|nr:MULTISPECIES: septum formation initiator family protein [Roseivirga]MEC7752717.1 septum formation initiator family protein [Bacteroidota bacterium]|tara:strand:+ start:2500 stop:2799 length:300 start_codon:yes stop_codon:yes gene_type:complete
MNPFTRIPKFLKNYYVLFGLFFVFWMIFIDSNDVLSQFRMASRLNELKAEKEYYLQKKQEVLKDREELSTNKELLEKFAREKYMMRKQSEDLYVIVTED